MSDEELQYIEGRRSDKFYVSRPFKNDQHARYAYEKFGPAERTTPRWVRDELVLKTERHGEQQLKALFYTDSRKIDTLALQWVSTKTGKPGVRTFSLQGDEINRLLAFAMFIRTAQLTQDEGARFSMADFETEAVLDTDARLPIRIQICEFRYRFAVFGYRRLQSSAGQC